ncbi:Na/Pi cotransporter family protein [Mangrovicoccus sp. HB161399]|uniref:Na/Pi cotransporter family protein n=1 Tax=Mangrovicoccus sp. HB161399 TaxID=2720392 RepID=UPI0015572AC4|nr:Na/Pi symporter [Mangrovicoccus sp. HB161399]
MTGDLVNALGGIGLFLFGMFWLTDGLRSLAGGGLRTALSRFTSTPLTGALTGAATTALIQSSSATTVTAVGFVSAGLLTFPQALGIIFGANIGTTMTGWLVAILGFKLDLGTVTLPLVFLGALLRLSGGRLRPQIGTALAGFALIFLGIDVMKESLAGFEGVVTPRDFPQDSLWGRLQLVAAGAAITLVTQSSSAGVTAALAAIGAGAISLPQGMALVIGMDVGTTFTAVLATLGGSTAARRTGFSHVIYNCLTGILAFVLLGPAAALLEGRGTDSQIALVAFHSGFNILGVILVLPFAGAFARLVTAVIRDPVPGLTGSLGPEMLRDPEAAADAAISALETVCEAQFRHLAFRLGRAAPEREDADGLRALAEALPELRRFTDAIPPASGSAPAPERLVSALHVQDHLGRLYFRCTEERRIAALAEDRQLRRLACLLGAVAGETARSADPAAAEQRLNKLRRLMRRRREAYRQRLLAQARRGGAGGEALARRLEAMRWLQRVSYHLWRIGHHMALIREGRAPVSQRREAAVDVLED